MKRICPLCHKEFTTKASRAKYCLDCRPLALKEVRHQNYLRWKAKSSNRKLNAERSHAYYLKRKEQIANNPELKAFYRARWREQNRVYREKLRADPEKYEKYLRRNREQARAYRDSPNYRARKIQREREYRYKKRLEQLQEKTCVICGTQFSTTRRNSVTCSNVECKRKRHIEMTMANQRLHKERKAKEENETKK